MTAPTQAKSQAASASATRAAFVGITMLLVACSEASAPTNSVGGASGSAAGGSLAAQAGAATSNTGGSGGAASAGAPGSAGATSPQTGGMGGAAGGAGGANSAGLGGSNAGGGGAAGAAGSAGATGSAGAAGVPLFDGTTLNGFTAYREPATKLTNEQALAIFKVEDQSIRVYGDAADQSTQARHTLLTTKSYSKYRLTLEYKWGTKKFAPYTDLQKYPRDAGVLFHVHADTTAVWPSSIEYQIKDGSTGDIFALYAQCTSLAKGGATTFTDADAGGTEKLVDGSTGFVQHARNGSFEQAGWNQVELEVNAGSAIYRVNGHVVNKVVKVMDKQGKAITSGPIALQAEHAEVFYRNVFILEQP